MTTIHTKQQFEDVLSSSSGTVIFGFLGDVVDRKEEIKRLTEFLTSHADRLRLYLVNSIAGTIWQLYNVSGKPTYLVFHDGNLAERWLGRMTTGGFEEILKKYNGKSNS